MVPPAGVSVAFYTSQAYFTRSEGRLAALRGWCCHHLSSWSSTSVGPTRALHLHGDGSDICSLAQILVKVGWLPSRL